jgi:hypothetical protein
MRLRSSTLEVMAVVKIYKKSGKNILGLGKGGDPAIFTFKLLFRI